MTALVQPTMAAAVAHARRTAVAPLAWDPAAHLLSRCAFGPTPAARRYVITYGPDRWFASQVAAARRYPGYRGHASVAAQGPLLSMSPYDVRQWLKARNREYGWDAMDQLTRVTLGLQAWSACELLEVLVDFFSNHLNVANHNGDVWNTRHAYDRDVIRANALGSFTSMLLASSKHPAMLTYLNLAESVKGAVNENYGRELLELHTVGLHYTESDVTNAARMLTGRTLDDNQHYLYDDYIHPTGPVRVLGWSNANTDPAAGERAGDALLRYLAAHPYTAQHLAQKLCVRLVSDAPSAALVNAVAKAYLAGRTQILPMVSTILRSTEFWQSRGRKVRRPTENLIATIRTLGVPVTNWADALDTLSWQTDGLGDRPLDWAAPNGYPDVASAWRSAGGLLSVWQKHVGYVSGWWDGLGKVDVPSLYAGAATSGEAIVVLTRRLTNTVWTSAHRGTLQTWLGEPASTPITRSRLAWMAEPLAAMVLHAPHHALR